MIYQRTVWILTWALGAMLLHAAPAQPASSVPWSPLPEALAEAEQTERPVLVYATAPWCGLCRKMERDVFPTVRSLLTRFARAEVNYDDHETRLTVSGQTQTPFAWVRTLGIEATPGFALLAPDGTPITYATGYLDANALSLLLAYVATGAYRHASFEAYAAQAAPH